MTSLVELDLSKDRLLGGRLRFRQPRRGYRTAIDPVLLAAAVTAEAGESVLDVGTGTGAAALCLAARVPGCNVVGLERDPQLLAIAVGNFAANGSTIRPQLVPGDLLAPPAAVTSRPFDHVMTNPPYHAPGAGTPPQTETGRAASLAEVDPIAWIRACLARLKPFGRLTLIHRADQLDVILAGLAGRAGDVILFPLWPDATTGSARRVIVSARKAARGRLRLARGLVLHRADGGFTPEAEAILRDGAPLRL